MKKMRKITSILCISLIFLSSLPVLAKRSTSSYSLDHVDVYLNGSIKIESQVNGITQSIKTGILEISNLSATIVENNVSRTYTNFSIQTQANGSRELEFHKHVQYFTTAATITISGTMKCKELNINTNFSKTFSGTEITKANQECPAHSGCDFRITDSEISNILTHDVIFQTETGGFINNGTTAISYSNIIDNSEFPETPSTKADENYTFVGWFDETGNIVTNFPKTVTKDYVFTAKWKEKELPSPTPVITPSPTPVIKKKETPGPTDKAVVTHKQTYPISDYVPVTGESDIIIYIVIAFLISGIGIIVILKHKKH